MEKGFTLIELLVVVLIIGILAAVAVPQYTKAVKKAQSKEIQVLIRNIRDAEESYFLANNTYTMCLNDLDLDILHSFTVNTETDGCVTKISKGSGSRKITITVSRYVDGSNLYGGSTSWTFAGYLGDYGQSGYGGYGVMLGFGAAQREPLSCIEYACHMVEEGSFCRQVLGRASPAKQRSCIRYYGD